MTQENKQTEVDPFCDLPEWVNFIATDKNGSKWAFENRPQVCTLGWWFVADGGKIMDIGEDRKAKQYWKYSLIERKK